MTDLSNWAPFQILAGPADVYVAPAAQAFPLLTAAPAAGWVYVGRTEGGVTVRHPQTVNQITADQHTGPIKAIRTEEGLEVEFSMVDLTLENYSRALNGALDGSDVVDTAAGAGTIGTREITLHSGVHVTLASLLVRGRSPYGNFPAQYEVPVTYQGESPEVSHVKDDKSVLACVWTALEDLSAATDDERFGRLIAQDAAAA